jgi:hypothetical protein
MTAKDSASGVRSVTYRGHQLAAHTSFMMRLGWRVLIRRPNNNVPIVMPRLLCRDDPIKAAHAVVDELLDGPGRV